MSLRRNERSEHKNETKEREHGLVINSITPVGFVDFILNFTHSFHSLVNLILHSLHIIITNTILLPCTRSRIQTHGQIMSV